MLEQPSHGAFRITVARGQECFLTSDRREAHRLELRHGSDVELWALCHWVKISTSIQTGEWASWTHQVMPQDQDPLLPLVDLDQGIRRVIVFQVL